MHQCLCLMMNLLAIQYTHTYIHSWTQQTYLCICTIVYYTVHSKLILNCIHIPTHMYPQLDSWWYFKGEHDGVKNWTAMPSIFPHGIEEVATKTGWPIVAHNRYWSGDTDYAKQVCVCVCVYTYSIHRYFLFCC